MNDNIMVSVLIMTYNHEKYIRQALESVMMQETTFPFEIIIGDDCSSDKTVEIIQEVIKDYRGDVILIAREKNIGMNANNFDIGYRARGKYIAEVEGDDYWIDKHKLQKQFEFLESHPECSVVAHKVAVVNEREHPIGEVKPDIGELNRYFGKEDAMKYQARLLHPTSVMYRNLYKKEEFRALNNSYRNFGGHKIFVLIMASVGKIYISDEVMAVFRFVTRMCASNARSLVLQNELFWERGKLDLYLYIKEYLSDSYDFTECISKEYINLRKYLYKKSVPEKKKIVSEYFKKLTWKEKLRSLLGLMHEFYFG